VPAVALERGQDDFAVRASPDDLRARPGAVAVRHGVLGQGPVDQQVRAGERRGPFDPDRIEQAMRQRIRDTIDALAARCGRDACRRACCSAAPGASRQA
jgi:hypothetical protein